MNASLIQSMEPTTRSAQPRALRRAGLSLIGPVHCWGQRTLRSALLAVGLSAILGSAAQKGLQIGDPFPDIGKYALEGELPEDLGGKVVIIDFWASWCGRCKGSFELMEQLNRRFAKRGLVVISVNVDESRAAMDAFLKEHPVSFNVVRDRKKSLVRAINIPSMPTLFVLDTEGKVRAIYSRNHGPEERERCISEVKKLLKVTTAE